MGRGEETGHGSYEHVAGRLLRGKSPALYLFVLLARSRWQLPFSVSSTSLSDPSTMATMTKTEDTTADNILDKLDELVPAPLAQFDAFPKLPSTYKTQSESRGFLTIFVAFVAFLLVLNDLGEYIWGWPDYEFGVDIDPSNALDINVDMVVNMPCQCKSPIMPLFLVFKKTIPILQRNHHLCSHSRVS